MSLLEYYISFLTDKHGIRLLPILEDIRARENSVLICSFGGDNPDAPVSSHLADRHGALIAAGLKNLSDAGSFSEVIIYAGALDVSAIVNQLSMLTGRQVVLKTGPSSPVLREPTALYSVLDTGIVRAGNAEEEYKRSFLSYGYQGRPTLVIDAETAYQAGRLLDAPGEPMTKHVVITGTDKKLVEIKEVPVGTALQALLEGQTIKKPVLLGGIWGSFVSLSDLKNTKIVFSYFNDAVRILGHSDCVVSITAELYKSSKEYSCAKCVLCREGSWQLHAIFSDIAEGKAVRDDIALIEDICPLISAGSLCAFGRHMVMPALTASVICHNELTDHIVGKNCASGQCRGLMSYVIDPALCTGCGECMDSCPEEAIEGQDGFIHMIDEKLCIKCGKCVPVCPEGAIRFGGEKIKVPKKLTKVGKFH